LLLELGRGQVTQRRVDPLPVVHVVQLPPNTTADDHFEQAGFRALLRE
jgi:hypothetical protein